MVQRLCATHPLIRLRRHRASEEYLLELAEVVRLRKVVEFRLNVVVSFPADLYITRFNTRMLNIVRQLREEAGLSQAELADRSGVAQPNVSAYESGKRRASAAMVDRLRRAARPLPRRALAEHRHEPLALAENYGLTNLRVFGSVMRGADEPGCDLDILATRSPGVGLMALAAFMERATELLGVEVDLVTDGGLRADHEVLTTAVAV